MTLTLLIKIMERIGFRKSALLGFLGVISQTFLTSDSLAGLCPLEIEVKLSGKQWLKDDYGDSFYGVFELKNESSSPLFFWLENGKTERYSPHGAYFEIQDNTAGRWELRTPILVTYDSPVEKVKVKPKHSRKMYVDLTAEFFPSSENRSDQLRVMFKDVRGCEYFSAIFQVSNEDRKDEKVNGVKANQWDQ
ncbi:MAG: hypothetical protein H7A20_09840 [Rhodanobacteraceae bacterium]|nr:hypothetical protein [Xanthomonadales bacterium]MCP5479063.1 hypothetical protein [Rhodanobacteraceae bacterium]HRY01459.1 hypothetical protein [Xanthomonadaceae bacterium]